MKDFCEAMRILLSGSSGFIGSSLLPFLEGRGHDVARIVRKNHVRSGSSVLCDAAAGAFDKSGFEGADAVIHLAGYGIIRRWTRSVKKKIRSSRVAGTRFLCSVFSELERPPKIFLCASAMGFYGDRGDALLSEQSPAGEGFLARLAQDWEQSASAASSRRTRVVNLRFGVALSKNGGVLAAVRLPFKLGLGATFGDRDGYISWVSLGDAVRAIEFLLTADSVSGPVNIVSPAAVRKGDFTRALAKAVRRPAFLHFGNRFVKLIFGQMGQEVMLAGARAVPEKLTGAGFVFEHADLESFLRAELG